jgi:hypothetical protein
MVLIILDESKRARSKKYNECYVLQNGLAGWSTHAAVICGESATQTARREND